MNTYTRRRLSIAGIILGCVAMIAAVPLTMTLNGLGMWGMLTAFVGLIGLTGDS